MRGKRPTKKTYTKTDLSEPETGAHGTWRSTDLKRPIYVKRDVQKRPICVKRDPPK